MHSSTSVSSAWRSVLLPWFQSALGNSWQSREPALVIVPHRSHAYALKALLLEEDVPLLGIAFLVPAELRARLTEGARLPLREHLRLLLAIAAEQHLDLPAGNEAREARLRQPDFLAAKSVAQEPDHFLRAMEQLSGAGWSLADAGPPALHNVFESFRRQVNRCGFDLIHEADRKTLAQSAIAAPAFSDILVAGFNAAHWPLWPLLRAAVNAARQATVLLDDPRDEARDLDETWIGAWEEVFGEAAVIPEDIRSDADQSIRSLGETIHFLVGSNTTEQAQAIVAAALHFLRGRSFSRLGILFPGPGALARTVAALLAELGIPHNDGLAHPAPGPFEDAAWQAWLEMQENPQCDALIRFLNAHQSGGFGGLSVRKIGETLRRAYSEVLIDDLALLREWCARQRDSAVASALSRGLAKLKFLPPRTGFMAFLAGTQEMFAQFGWHERWLEIERLSKSWSDRVEGQLSRHTYLRWLSEISHSFYASRQPEGDHPYSHIHLLAYEQAEGQAWSHLILAGMNEGGWPPRHDEGAGFLREEDLESLNRRVRKLNRRALRQGRQGEGHWSVEEGKTLCLGPAEQRQLAHRQLLSLVESATEGLAITANLFQESAPERVWNPGEFFTRLYFGARGKALSAGTMQALQNETRQWLAQAGLRTENSLASAEVQQTRIAYEARRKPQPAGEYEFSLRESPSRPISLRVTEWEKALTSPALIWMKTFLGVEGGEERGDRWSAATGQWVHRWLARISAHPGTNRFALRPGPEEMRRRTRAAARGFRADLQSLCFAACRALPDWWSSGWSNALFLADCLAVKLSGLNDWPMIATEWSLDPAHPVALGAEQKLRLRGRIDLILTLESDHDSALGGKNLWLVDYKTGSKKGLVSSRWRTPADRTAGVRKKLQSGAAVQLGLYSLAAKSLDAKEVALGILSPLVDPARPQLQLSDIAAHPDFWAELYRMQETGIFGMLGPVQSEFSFTGTYPLATLGIDPDLLKEKWALTHPAFADPTPEDAE